MCRYHFLFSTSSANLWSIRSRLYAMRSFLSFSILSFSSSARFSNVTYLTRSAHAQTKYGTHFAYRTIYVKGYITVSSKSLLISFSRYLLYSLSVRNLSIVPCTVGKN